MRCSCSAVFDYDMNSGLYLIPSKIDRLDRARQGTHQIRLRQDTDQPILRVHNRNVVVAMLRDCLLYTSDAADE